jgi:hypothetical protein
MGADTPSQGERKSGEATVAMRWQECMEDRDTER